MMNILFFSCLFLYFIAVLLQFSGMTFKKEKLLKLAWFTFIAAFVLQTIYLLARGILAKRLPLSNQFEFAFSFSWGVAILYLFLKTRFRIDWITAAAYPATFLLLSYAALLPKEITELMPALRSMWFGLHIGSAVFSYAAFALAGCAGVRYLLELRKGSSPDSAGLKQIDYFSYRLIAWGMLMLTVVILSGCVWAEQAWSAFWTWDPKETWALVTWIIYAVYLHQRLRKNWMGKRMAIFAVIAVPVVLFTFIGVNQLLPSLHSYV